jgi:hypothetical protein
MLPAGNQNVRPLVGGIQIGTSTTMATLGLVHLDGYFITAGHAVGPPGSFVGQPDASTFVGRVEHNFINQNTDLAIVKINVGILGTVNTIWSDQQGPIEVRFETGKRPAVGGKLWLQSSRGKIQCSVQIAAADVTEAVTGRKVSHVVLLDLGSAQTQPGDSGSPVVGEKNICYGVYGGRVVYDNKTYGWFTPFENMEWS